MDMELSESPIGLFSRFWAVGAGRWNSVDSSVQTLELAADAVQKGHKKHSAKAFLCDDKSGWAIYSEYRLNRCFYQGVILQFPTLLTLLFVIPGFFQLRNNKLLVSIPADKRRVHNMRLIVQTVLSIALFAFLIAESYLGRHNDISRLSPFLSAISVIPAVLVSFVEFHRSMKPHGSLLMYWLFFATARCFYVFTDLSNIPYFLDISIAATSTAIFLLEWLQPRRMLFDPDAGSEIGASENRYSNPYDEADLFSRLTFSWMTPTMRKGYQDFLESKDLPPLASTDRTDSCNSKLEYYWKQQLKKDNPSLFFALLQSFGVRYFIGGLCKSIQDIIAFLQPWFLKMLISFVNDYSNGKETSLYRGIMISMGMFVVSVITTLSLHQYFERSFGVGMNVRTSVTNAIFQKSLVLSSEARATRTTGDTVNLMSIDTQRLQDVCTNGHMIWSGPLQIIMCLISLYKLVGDSMWVGVVILIILVPINSYLASNQKQLQKQQMADKDLRTRLTSELLSCIKSIKLFAWEDSLVSRLDRIRDDQELVSLRKIGVFQASMSYIWTFTPFVVSCSTFAVYVYLGSKPLTIDIVFPAVALFNMLGFPMAIFPNLISSLIEANVALNRVTNYLTGEELQPDAVTRVASVENIGDVSVSMKDGCFTFTHADTANDKLALRNINFEARKGELVCVVGKVGSGKSTLLLSMTGDIRKVSGIVTVAGDVAYVSQDPWIFNGSVRENILFGRKYDEQLYNETIAACSLTDDLNILPDGDTSLVGEKGLSLSGGQKARISLARAVYARADVYLLDDPLSAVDEHVGQHIIANVLGKNGLLSTKTIVLATNNIPVLNQADKICMISNGELVEQGSVGDNIPKIQALLSEFGRSKKDESSSEAASTQGIQSKGLPESADSERIRRGSTRRPALAALTPVQPPELNKEHSEKGKVSWDIYKQYAKVCGYRRIAAYFVVLMFAITFLLAGNIWLKKWGEENTKNNANLHIGYYLTVYAVLGVISSALSVVQNLIAYVFINIRAARILHENMLHAVVRAPMAFFETNPLGRIVNRFSSDVYRVDQQLARVFSMLFSNCFRVIITVGVILYSTPLFAVLLLPLAYMYLYYQQYYLRTSRELKRLDSVSKSPIFAQFQETLDGIATIRAYDATERFNYNNRCYLDANNRAYFPSISANRWLAVRLEYIGSVIILAASSLAVLSLPSGRISAGVIGLSLSYALQITQSLNWIVRMTVEVETNIVSVERMMEYSNLTPEAPEIIPQNRPPIDWPAHGNLNMVNYSARYRPELPLALKNINLTIQSGEKIGIVGRTGAGKSSLTLALFRLIEPDDGYIVVDGMNTSDLGLKDLRSRLSIIPQDAQLFEGTVRINLDPAAKYSDDKLWRALELAHLKTHISTMDGHLDAKISEGGSNLSAGQRQLLSLARALLTDSKILVMDEATAAVDVETDKVIQQVIRSEFKDRTILTIAHRLNTILDSDRVVVLSFGEIAEFDSPETLMKNPESLFADLCRRGGI